MSITAHRIYNRERITVGDVRDLAPDTVLLRGVKPPQQTEGGLLRVDSSVKDHPVRACVAFEIAALPAEQSKGNPLELKAGDTVLCRNAVVDPLYGNELAICDMYLGIIAVIERS